MQPRRRFRFLKELSEGAFGKVYLAEMVTGDRFSSVVAIKLLHGKWTGHTEIVQRSRDEARVLGLLHHRNIIRVEDLTSINGQCAVVMEYLDGVDIKTLVAHCRDNEMRLPRKVAFEVTSQVASALHAAYSARPLQGGDPLQVIHRDIKPSNVMVTTAGEVKVLDFGTAQASFDEREAHTQALAFGSAAYMAPERLLGDPDTPFGDVFSLGVTLYEMLALDGFGKINIRPEKFDRRLNENLESMDLEDLGEERAAQVRAALRLMLSYEEADRPTAGQVVELTEALAEEIHDGSMRRFCREVVGPCRATIEPKQNPDDPLTGSTLFEDTGSMMRELGDPSGGGDTWIEEGLEGSEAPLVAEETGADSEQAAETQQDAAEEPVSDPAEAQAGAAEAVAEEPAEAEAEAEEPAEESAAAAEDSASVEAGEGDGAPAASEEDDGSAAGDPEAPAAEADAESQPEPAVAEASTSEAVDEPAAASTPPVAVAVASTPAKSPTPAATPAKEKEAGGGSGGGFLKVALVLVALGVVGAGGVALVAAGGLMSTVDKPDEQPDKPPVEEPVKEAPVASADALAGGSHELAPSAPDNGTVVLSLAGSASAVVQLKGGSQKVEWDGSGELELVGAEGGTWRSKASTAEGSSRATFDVVPGQTCRYRYDVGAGADSWEALGCE